MLTYRVLLQRSSLLLPGGCDEGEAKQALVRVGRTPHPFRAQAARILSLELTGLGLRGTGGILKHCTSIAFLFLAGNKLESLDSVHLWPSLVRIDLRDNQLTDLGRPNLWGLAPHVCFLHLDNNRIQDLTELVKLRALHHLVGLSLMGNPVAEDPQYRHFIVNLIPSLQYLDGTVVTNVERVSFLSDPLRLQENYEWIDLQGLEVDEALAGQLASQYVADGLSHNVLHPLAFDDYNVHMFRQDLLDVASAVARTCPILRLQAHFRGALTRLRHRREQERRSGAAIVIQSFARMHLHVARFGRLIALRLLMARRAVRIMQAACRVAHTTIRARQIRREELRREVAARKIANAYRDYIFRRTRRITLRSLDKVPPTLRQMLIYIAQPQTDYVSVVSTLETLIRMILSETHLLLATLPEAHPDELKGGLNAEDSVILDEVSPYQLLRVESTTDASGRYPFELTIRKRELRSWLTTFKLCTTYPGLSERESDQMSRLRKHTACQTACFPESVFSRTYRALSGLKLPTNSWVSQWRYAENTPFPYFIRLELRLFCISSVFRFLMSECQGIDWFKVYPPPLHEELRSSLMVGQTMVQKYLSQPLRQELISLFTTGRISGAISLPSYKRYGRSPKSLTIVILPEHELYKVAAACSIQAAMRAWRSNTTCETINALSLELASISAASTTDTNRDPSSIRAPTAMKSTSSQHEDKQTSRTPTRTRSRTRKFKPPSPSSSPLLPPIVRFDPQSVSESSDQNKSQHWRSTFSDSKKISEEHMPPSQNVGPPSVITMSVHTLVPSGSDHISWMAQTKGRELTKSASSIHAHTRGRTHARLGHVSSAIMMSRAAKIIQRHMRGVLARMRALVLMRAATIFAEVVQTGFFLMSSTVYDHLFNNSFFSKKSNLRLPHVTSFAGEDAYLTLLPPLSDKFGGNLTARDQWYGFASNIETDAEFQSFLAARKEDRRALLSTPCDWMLSTSWVFRGYHSSSFLQPTGLYEPAIISSLTELQTPEQLDDLNEEELAVSTRSFANGERSGLRSSLKLRRRPMNLDELKYLCSKRAYGHPKIRQWAALEVRTDLACQDSFFSSEYLYRTYLESLPSKDKGSTMDPPKYSPLDFNFIAVPLYASVPRQNSKSDRAQLARGFRSTSSLAASGAEKDENPFEQVVDTLPYRFFCSDIRLSRMPSALADRNALYLRMNKNSTLVKNLRIIKAGLTSFSVSKYIFPTALSSDFKYVTAGLRCVGHRAGCSSSDLAFKAALIELWFCNPFRHEYSRGSFRLAKQTFLHSPGLVLTPQAVTTMMAIITLQRIFRGYIVRSKLRVTHGINTLINFQLLCSGAPKTIRREVHAIQVIQKMVSDYTDKFGPYPDLSLPASPERSPPQRDLVYMQPPVVQRPAKLVSSLNDIDQGAKTLDRLPLRIRAGILAHELEKYAPITTSDRNLMVAYYRATKEMERLITYRENRLRTQAVTRALETGPTRPLYYSKQKAAFFLNELRDLTTRTDPLASTQDKIRLADVYSTDIFLPERLFVDISPSLIKIASQTMKASPGSTRAPLRACGPTPSVCQSTVKASCSLKLDTPQCLESESERTTLAGGSLREKCALDQEVERFDLKLDEVIEQDLPPLKLPSSATTASTQTELPQPRRAVANFPLTEEIFIRTQMQREALHTALDEAALRRIMHTETLANEIRGQRAALRSEQQARFVYGNTVRNLRRAKAQAGTGRQHTRETSRAVARNVVRDLRALDTWTRFGRK
ncbi:Leucine-rich repeat protein [Giardia muris]|uniref:Leucine-rich repeat protein n=1 Tax=Giardia muris TaxID=5742 RepID=A0A4Z1T8A7_GIAMU|nr:Leucine-rich repeat protein [Giardia muris]|eukprot:TNJ28741.1 Leucine-rich repeat protein [Giardia muris]